MPRSTKIMIPAVIFCAFGVFGDLNPVAFYACCAIGIGLFLTSCGFWLYDGE
jgi:hypothetical protein